MFENFKRRHCPFRVCNGRVLDDEGRCDCRVGRNNKIICHFCDHSIFDPCGTCAAYHECMCDWKEKGVQ